MKKVYIIAEAGVNHNGSLELAKQLIDTAALAGADAVKFQTFKAENIVSKAAPKADYQKNTTNAEESQLEMIRKLELTQEHHQILVDYCIKKKIQFLSTPFDLDSVDLLVNVLDLPRLKLPSGDLTNAPLLLKAAQSGKPIILSTGMCTLAEVEAALGVLTFGYLKPDEPPSLPAFQKAWGLYEGRQILKDKVTLLHCTTEYPTPYSSVNLRAMDTMRSAFELPVGLSDHTPGIAISVAAAAREAMVIEKHFTLDRELPGPDHKASLEPDELLAMVEGIRAVEKALGTSAKVLDPVEWKNRDVARKSLITTLPVRQGELFTSENLSTKRPGTGIPPWHYWEWLGKRADRNYKKDEIL